jgi:HlyD family secretion protein
MTLILSKKLSKPWLFGLGIGVMALFGGGAYYQLSLVSKPQAEPIREIPITKISALGRLEPEGEVIQVSAPLALDGDRVSQLLVKEGDTVKAGQIIAILDSRDRLQDELRQAQQQVSAAQAKLAQAKAGAKTGEIEAQRSTIVRLEAERQGEIEAQKATIERWQAEVRNARVEYERFGQLYQQGGVSSSNLDTKRLAAETAQAQLKEAIANSNRTAASLQAQINEAKATLSRITDIRPVDIQPLQTEVEGTIVAVKKAENALAKAEVRAPISGQILKIQTRLGEKVSDKGIADLAQTANMVAVTEVYQSDISKIKPRQKATVTSQAFSGELPGTVLQIGREVKQQNVFSNQPGENLDRRIIEVKIRLENSQKVAGLTNLQVQTIIALN